MMDLANVAFAVMILSLLFGGTAVNFVERVLGRKSADVALYGTGVVIVASSAVIVASLLYDIAMRVRG